MIYAFSYFRFMVGGGYKVYDPFMGTGTTAIACEELNMNCYGSEISEAQVEYSIDRLKNFKIERNKNNAK